MKPPDASDPLDVSTRDAPPPIGAPLTAPPAPPDVALWLLALVTFSGTLAMHMFVPALPYAAEALHASPGAMQMTISLYIVGLGVGQLIYGPASDRFGRKPALMVGLALYTVAGLAAALAPGAGALIAARLFQALGGCAGMVLGRAIVRDTSAPQEAAGRLALMNLMVVLGPGIAPIAGSLLAGTLGWRSILWALAALGVLNLVVTWRLLPETGGVDARANADVRTLARNYFGLLRSRAFLGFAVGGGCATTAMYAFIASAPFILVHQLGKPAGQVGFYIAALIVGLWLGSVLASRLIHRVQLRTMIVWGNGLSLLAAIGLLGLVLSGHLAAVPMMGLMFLFTLGAGVASPAALTEAIGVNPLVIGSASGLYGAMQMTVGAVCTAIAGLGSDPALTTAIVLVVAGVVGQTAFWIASRQPRG